MRVLLLLIAAAAAVAAVGAQAAPSNTLSVDPLGPALGIYNMEFEKALTEKTALAFYGGFSAFAKNEYKYGNLGGGACLRFYFSSRDGRPCGWYAGPDLDAVVIQAEYPVRELDAFGNGRFTGTDTCGSGTVGFSGEIGYKLSFGDDIQYTISPFVKLGRWLMSPATWDGERRELPGFDGFYYRVGINIGVSF